MRPDKNAAEHYFFQYFYDLMNLRIKEVVTKNLGGTYENGFKGIEELKFIFPGEAGFGQDPKAEVFNNAALGGVGNSPYEIPIQIFIKSGMMTRLRTC